MKEIDVNVLLFLSSVENSKMNLYRIFGSVLPLTGLQMGTFVTQNFAGQGIGEQFVTGGR